ncbi:response regulator [Marinomonas balearica]|uniref:histidine kinase n=1 Tax=Marinomonas balearica TaxID=491947 RepID=A0A4R6M7S2_9GAMM|nr:response regulator [Marinomonas balearica]TDO97478.1 putative ATPase [Marinomonas balearica]
MIEIPGYQVQSLLSEGKNSLVFKAIRQVDSLPVAMKLLRDEFPTIDQINAFKREYSICSKLEHVTGVVNVMALERYESSVCIVYEYVSGSSLSTYLTQHSVSLREALSIALRIATSLSEIHGEQVIHGDLTPRNILWDSRQDTLKLLDFGIACEFGVREPRSHSQNFLGSLHYTSPEQTGRVNRALDYRADYYSLGATLYHLLSAQPPFETEDPVHLIHCHLAVEPTPLVSLISSVPKAVSDVVQKLLAKTPEGRYQSASGLIHDLRRCIDELDLHNKISDFMIGQRDQSSSFSISNKLYGREKQIAQLSNAVDSSFSGDAVFGLISGYAGIGKSALINELRQPIEAKNGFFIQGKFDQYNRDLPYSAIKSACHDLIGQILSEDETKIEVWRESLVDVLGENGRVMTDFIPDLSLIIGDQPKLADVSAIESQNRFNIVFPRFIELFSDEKHPLVIFWDDLQWADSASLQLIENIARNSQMHHLLLLGAYRENEITAADKLLLVLKEIRQQAHFRVINISLEALSLEHVESLIADTVNRNDPDQKALAKRCFNKTLGNPFFLNQLLEALHKEALLYFDRLDGRWSWNIDRIDAWQVSDNVVDLMQSKIHRLPQESQTLCQLAACIGNEFDLVTLASLDNREINDVEQHIHNAVSQGIVIYKGRLSSTRSTSSMRYRFLHDQVQQAAYFLASDVERSDAHFKLGKLLIGRDKGELVAEDLFSIVNHLNRSISLIDSEEFKLKLVHYNLAACQRAKRTNAYDLALTYINVANELLGESAWEANSDLKFECTKESAEAEQLCGDIEAAHAHCHALLEHASSDLAKADVYALQTELYSNHGRFSEALESGCAGIRLLGIHWPDDSEELEQAMLSESERINAYLANNTVSSLLALPEMSDATQVTLSKLYGLIWGPAINVNLPMSTLAVVKMVVQSIEYGNGDISPFGYANYGSMLSAFFGDYQSGYDFGELAVNLVEKTNNIPYRCKVYTMFGVTNSAWTIPVRESIKLLRVALTAGMDVGDRIWISYSAFHILKLMKLAGFSIAELQAETKTIRPIIESMGDPNTIEVLEILERNNRLLSGESSNLYSWDEEGFSEDEFVQGMEDQKHALCLNYYHTSKMLECLLFGRFEEGVAMANQAEATLPATFGWLTNAEYYFIQSLLLTSLEDGHPFVERRQKQLHSNLSRLKDWANHNAHNFIHRELLLEAEIARLEGNDTSAIDLYDKAIELALDNGFKQHAALANELAARFWQNKNKRKFAYYYLREAHHGYMSWGAYAKANQLEKDYPELIRSRDTYSEHYTSQSFSETTISSGNLDLMSVMRAVQIISEEIVLEQLLEKMMSTILAEAGAQKGTLVLNMDGQWRVQASGNIQGDEIEVMQDRALSDDLKHELPLSIITYVRRTHVPVIIDDARQNNNYRKDVYVAKNGPLSVLCYPILKRGKIIGLLYLENNLVSSAFTSDRLQALNILAGQAAISIENAMVYETLEKRVNKRTEQLNDAKVLAEEANRAKSLFLATMSHEIRTPMNAIIGLSRLILKTPLNTDQKDFMDKVLESAEGLLGIINDILDYSKIEAHKMVLEQTRFELQDVLSRIITVCSLKAKEKGLELHIDIAPDVPTVLLGDPLRLQQVLTNLVINAIKFTEIGFIGIRVSLEESNDELPHVRFDVTDSGVGLTQDHQRELFKPFTQADASITRKYGGTGLGLAICRQLVELMKGSIWVRSHFGKGSTFGFRIPVHTYQEEGDLAYKNLDFSKVKVLVVDDSNVARRALVYMLKEIGVQCDNVGAPIEALECIREGNNAATNYDILLMERYLAGVDCLDTIRKIKKESSNPNLAGVIVSSFSEEEKQLLCDDHVVDDVLDKPVDLSSLRQILIEHFPDRLMEMGSTADQTEETADLKHKRVLLVEDNELNRRVVMGYLEESELIIDTAHNGQEALDKVGNAHYDLVLMDLQMPVMDGLTATRKIRTFFDKNALPIVAMTAHASVEDKQRCLEAGMNDYVTKPIDIDELYRALRRHVSSSTETPLQEPLSGEEADVNFVQSLYNEVGLDTHRALSRLKQRLPLYVSTVIEFNALYRNVVEELQACLKSDDREALYIKVHSLKSNLAYIGAMSAFELVQDLETSLANNKPSNIEFERVCSILSPLLKKVDQSVTNFINCSQTEQEFSISSLNDLVSEIQTRLEQSDFSVEKYLNELKNVTKETPWYEHVLVIDKLVDDVEFEKAATVITELKKQLEL